MDLQYIKDKLSLLPMQPGCYLMKDKDGTVIYVGKAKIKNRFLLILQEVIIIKQQSLFKKLLILNIL